MGRRSEEGGRARGQRWNEPANGLTTHAEWRGSGSAASQTVEGANRIGGPKIPYLPDGPLTLQPCQAIDPGRGNVCGPELPGRRTQDVVRGCIHQLHGRAPPFHQTSAKDSAGPLSRDDCRAVP
ncbi:MAG: hypothetical protein M1815_003194 [Lichina confinis]|nr:MAG: hypothetical protein M1815_003194 [Lichina confinis]